ncbi:MAG: hypothetical protein IJI68_00660 [Eggerthellaceae bacterium]|nr:hypothetical protein [Eggerthellaceae bacterium]
MSDCSTNAWAVPKESGIPRHDGTDELVIDVYATPEQIAGARSLRIRQVPGAVFIRRHTCYLVLEYVGSPCNDYRCSFCGKVHNAPRAGNFCPRCGSIVLYIQVPATVEEITLRELPEVQMMEFYTDLAYEEDRLGLEGFDRLVVHDEKGEQPDVYYRRVTAKHDELRGDAE